MILASRLRTAGWLACCLALAATSPMPGQEIRREQTTVERTGQETRVRRVSTLMEARVALREGARIGQVVDFVINEDGCIDYVVVAYEDKYVLVPWRVSTVSFEDRVIRLDITRERWREVPTFTRERWPDLSDTRYTERIQTIFGVRPDRREGRPGGAIEDRTIERRPGTGPDRGTIDRGGTDRRPERPADRGTGTDRGTIDRGGTDRRPERPADRGGVTTPPSPSDRPIRPEGTRDPGRPGDRGGATSPPSPSDRSIRPEGTRDLGRPGDRGGATSPPSPEKAPSDRGQGQPRSEGGSRPPQP